MMQLLAALESDASPRRGSRPGGGADGGGGGLTDSASVSSLRGLLQSYASNTSLADLDQTALAELQNGLVALARSSSLSSVQGAGGGGGGGGGASGGGACGAHGLGHGASSRGTLVAPSGGGAASGGASSDGAPMWLQDGPPQLSTMFESPSASSLVDLVRSSSATSLYDLLHSYSAANLAGLATASTEEPPPENA